MVCVSIVHYKFERLYSISSFEFESYGLTLDWLQLTTILSLNNLKSSLHSLPTNFQAFYLHEVRNFRFTFSFFYFAPCTNKVQHFISLFIFNDTCILFTTNIFSMFFSYNSFIECRYIDFPKLMRKWIIKPCCFLECPPRTCFYDFQFVFC